MKRRYLASTRGRVHLVASLVLAVVVGVALGSASHPAMGVLGSVSCAAVLVVLGYAVFIIEARASALTRRVTGIEASTNTLTRRVKGVEASTNTLTRRLKGGRSGISASVATPPSSGAESGPSHPAAVTAGRGSAPGLPDTDDERTLWQLSQELPQQPLRVATIAAEEFLAQLPVADVVPLVPGYATESLERGSYRALVLDRSAFSRGPWAGTESAVGIHLLQQLEAVKEVARRRGIPVLLVDAPLVPDISTQDVRSLADLVFPMPPHDFPPEGTATSELLSSFQQLARERIDAAAPTGMLDAPAAPVTIGSARD